MDDALQEQPVYILETYQRDDIDRVSRVLKKLLPSEWRLSPLFPESPNEPFHGNDFNLSCFWELQRPGVDFRELDASPYDFAYDLLEQAALRSVEPDIPSGIYQPIGADGGSPCEEPPGLCPPDRGWALRNIRAPQAWRFLASLQSPMGADILIAQPDTGVADHVDLGNCLNLSKGMNFLEVGKPPIDPLQRGFALHPGHGTATSSVAVSRGTVIQYSPPNSLGTGLPGLITGSANASTIVPIRAIKSVVRITQHRVAKAVEYASRSGCHVISMSLGGLPLRALEAALANAVKSQLIAVAAAGNCVGVVVWPGRYRSVICIGGSNIHDRPWKGSSNGSRVDVSAPAEFVWRAIRESGLDAKPYTNVGGGQGTSYATALTAGVAALWLTGRRDQLINALTPGSTLQEAFRACLKSTARRVPLWNWQRYGDGIVDAMTLLSSGCGVAPASGQGASGRMNYGQEATSIAEEILRIDRRSAQIYDILLKFYTMPETKQAYFGHEIIALLSEYAWNRSVGVGVKDIRQKLSLNELNPSKRLLEAIRG